MRAQEFVTEKAIKESVQAYHGTFQPTLTHFNALSHFGTLQAAQDRLKEKSRREKIKTPGHIYQVTLDIKNPFVAKDFAGVHSPTHFAFDLRDRKLISQEEMLKITTLSGNPKQAPALIKKLHELGFDSIAYKNKHEDKGSTSYVILDPKQVVSIKPVEVEEPVTEARLPNSVEDFLYNLTPEDVGVDEIGPWRIHYEGFTDDCQSSADYRKNPEAVYQQVFADHIRREGGREPVEQNFTGDEDYPILYSIFRIPKQVKELFDRPVKHEPTNARTKQRFKTDVDGHEIQVHFNPKGDQLEIDFYVDGRGFAVNNTIENPGKVFSAAVRTIIDRLPDAVARYKPKTVWYKAVGNDESRVSLYKKLLSVFQQALGSDWSAKTFKNGGWQFYELDKQSTQTPLNEIGNAPAEYTPNRKRSRSLFHATVDGHWVDVFFDRSEFNGTLHITFAVDGNYDTPKMPTEASKSTVKILSTVLNIVKRQLPEYIAKARPPGISFTAKEDNRAGLYRKYFVPVIQNILGSKWTHEEHPSMGMTVFHWSPVKAKEIGENFADGKGPGRPGDSQRHGIPKGATIAQLEKASHAKGRKGQLARWQLNMRRGKKK